MWDRSELKDMFLSAKNSIFGEKNTPSTRDEPGLATVAATPTDMSDSDNEDIYS